MKVLVTGASGFVGAALVRSLLEDGRHLVRAVYRYERPPMWESVDWVRVAGLTADADWEAGVLDIDLVIHAAARVHMMPDTAADPVAEFRRVNVAGTLALAEQAAAAGVRRFVFVSSIKVNGEETAPGRAFHAAQQPKPVDPYGISKFEAERGLRALAERTGMELVIIRPPMVHGPGVKGNFAAMMDWLRRGVPLPLGAVTCNRRSLVGLDNLVDFILTCVEHPAAANETFLVSDGEDLSLADLLRRLGRAMGHPARLIPVPPSLLMAAARWLGKDDVARRLFGSLQVDLSHTSKTLGWTPPFDLDEGLRRTARGKQG
ncbi:Cholesterol dehydrogenase [Thiorhodovibrio winogradskyi]|uniref:Cholesterol dehydrogenase n=1 Tax=Thiorhodovibrio winogradskyi TaxID=77007 RepID=A0ABZ0S9D3_9GAMM|nr:SDR family oxidoreductase [Thiorhodovibrio winogradskyi]